MGQDQVPDACGEGRNNESEGDNGKSEDGAVSAPGRVALENSEGEWRPEIHYALGKEESVVEDTEDCETSKDTIVDSA